MIRDITQYNIILIRMEKEEVLPFSIKTRNNYRNMLFRQLKSPE